MLEHVPVVVGGACVVGAGVVVAAIVVVGGDCVVGAGVVAAIFKIDSRNQIL